MMRSTTRFGALIIMLVVGGCGLRTSKVDSYEGPPKSDQELAIIRENDAYLRFVRRGDRSYYEEQFKRSEPGRVMLKLLPGKYDIHYFSSGSKTFTGISYLDTLDLKAGHLYVVNSSILPLLFNLAKRRNLAWIEDETTGEVISGSPYEELPMQRDKEVRK